MVESMGLGRTLAVEPLADDQEPDVPEGGSGGESRHPG